MALLWVEGFEGYGNNGDQPKWYLQRRYADVYLGDNRMYIEAGRFSGYSLRTHQDTYGYFSTPSLTVNDTIIVGFALKFTRSLTGIYDFLILKNGATESVFLSYVNHELRIVYSSGFETTSTGNTLLQADTWYYIELKVKCNITTGEYTVKVDGNIELQDVNVNTKNGTNDYHDAVRFQAGSAAFWFDDIYILDSTGVDNNNILGDTTVTAIYPTGDDSIQWARGGGATNSENVNEEPEVDDDTTYVEDSTTNNTDLYTYENSADLSTILGIQINTECKGTDTTFPDILTPMKLGASQSDGPTTTIEGASYTTKMRVAEKDPDGNDWTLNNINSTLFGLKVG
jgi:hypothetical protein